MYSPTRQNHILDLVFASTLFLIKELRTSPRMSDHEMVMFSITCKHPSINKKTPCRVYFYHKGDISSLLQEFQETFSASDPSQNSLSRAYHIMGYV